MNLISLITSHWKAHEYLGCGQTQKCMQPNTGFYCAINVRMENARGCYRPKYTRILWVN